ncbi:MAG: hypothetical protein ACOCV2_06095 [Persicimonas sp.]
MSASLLLTTGCARGEVPEREQSSSDAGGEPDAGYAPDGGTEPKPKTQTLAPSGGGAQVETSEHKIRLIVAPQGGFETVETNDHRIRMGAGAAQHAQD